MKGGMKPQAATTWWSGNRKTCLTALDGRSNSQYLGKPCGWCKGQACSTDNSNKCEPQEWLENVKGKNKGVDFEWCMAGGQGKTY